MIVRETHRRLMANRQPEIAGEYRDCPVSVGTHDQPSPAVVRMKVEGLLQFRPATAAEVVRCHVAFETIHPFQDGNERTGRMSYYWHCHQSMSSPSRGPPGSVRTLRTVRTAMRKADPVRRAEYLVASSGERALPSPSFPT